MKKGVLAKYHQYLPLTDKTPHVFLGEGDTPLVKSERALVFIVRLSVLSEAKDMPEKRISVTFV